MVSKVFSEKNLVFLKHPFIPKLLKNISNLWGRTPNVVTE